MTRSALLEAKHMVVDTGRRMLADRLVEDTAGNLSVREGDRVVITPSSVPYDQITIEDLFVLDLDGALVATAPPDRRPSTETGMHLLVYRETDARAVVHHHGLRSTAVSTLVDTLPPLHYYATRLGGPTRVAPYARYGTEELARGVLAALEGRSAALMQNHGALTLGSSMEHAYKRAELLEWLCSLYLQAASAGAPRALTTQELTDAARGAYQAGAE